jgi:hypothetical protein
MKSQFLLSCSAAVVLGLTACDSQNSSTSEAQASAESAATAPANTTEALKARAENAASEVKETAQQAATEVKAAAEKTATEVKQTAQNLAANATSNLDKLRAEAQNLIEKAQSLVKDKRFEDATGIVQKLSNMSLSPEQQKSLEDLKSQLKALMSNQVVTNAASAINNLLKK